MKQFHYTIQTLIRDRRSCVIKVISLSLGLLVSIILFSRVAFELSYDNCFQDVDNLYIVKTEWIKDAPAPPRRSPKWPKFWLSVPAAWWTARRSS